MRLTSRALPKHRTGPFELEGQSAVEALPANPSPLPWGTGA